MNSMLRLAACCAAAMVWMLVQAPRPAQACSVCLAGDPLYDALGTSAQEKGSFSTFLELRGFSKESGVLPHEEADADHDADHDEAANTDHGADHAGEGTEFSDNKRLDLYLSWTPWDRVTFTANLPWRWNEITEVEGLESETSRLNGFGDMALAATGVLWRNRDVLPGTWVEGRTFLKFPTGQSERAVNGKKDPHLQVGTGSWDFGFGLASAHKVSWGTLYGSAFYRVNTEGSLDYEYGDVVLANTSLQVPVGHVLGESMLRWLTASLQMNFRWAGMDESHGVSWEDSGGSILYVTPGVAIQTPWFGDRRGPVVQASAQLPVTQSWLNGRQHEDPVWAVGLRYAF
jgi:hypothetical protein